MAWGPNPNTEEELEKLAAVREYFHEHFPNAEIRDSYDTDRMAQVFRVEKVGKVLMGWRVAEHVQSAKGAEVIVSSWGVEEKAR